MIEIPHIFVQTVIYAVIVYSMIGFEWTVTKFFWYLFFMYFTFLYFTFYGMMTVAVTPSLNFAYIVATGFYAMWNLFSGFIIPKPVSPIGSQSFSQRESQLKTKTLLTYFSFSFF